MTSRLGLPLRLLALTALAGGAAATLVAASAGCNASTQQGCRVNDDCRATICTPGQLGQCRDDGSCACRDDYRVGDVGRYSAFALQGATAFVCAYNQSYGDLMIGQLTPPGVVEDWRFIDGVPDVFPAEPLSRVRGGITEEGDDVGRYCSIQIAPDGDPVVSYHDKTNGHLRYAHFGAVTWQTHVVDKGPGTPRTGDDVGRFTSLTFGKDGTPGIAYYAEVAKGASGGRESQLRFAQAKVPYPREAADWTITTIEKRPLPTLDPKAVPPPIPDGVGLFASAARKASGAPVVVYYDNAPAAPGGRPRGNLALSEYDPAAKVWKPADVLDGEGPMGKDTADVGWYPSIAIGADDVAHVSYVDATRDNLLYVNTKTRAPEVVDDGYRAKSETTIDGLPAPVHHLVGDSSSIALSSGDTITIAYQDSTMLQLRYAVRDPKNGQWKHEAIAGHTMPFKGAYGFYAHNRVSGGAAVVSSYAINQKVDPPQFFVELFGVTIQTIIQ